MHELLRSLLVATQLNKFSSECKPYSFQYRGTRNDVIFMWQNESFQRCIMPGAEIGKNGVVYLNGSRYQIPDKAENIGYTVHAQ